jgi:uncharacterized DUF497 family protein
MKYEWDENKNQANIVKHGISFEELEYFDWEVVAIQPDNKQNYNEQRYAAQSFIGGRLYVLIFTIRGDNIRAISLRKASKQEMRDYYNG